MKKIKWGQIYITSEEILVDEWRSRLLIPIKMHPENPFAVVVYDVGKAEELNCGDRWFDDQCSILEATE